VSLPREGLWFETDRWERYERVGVHVVEFVLEQAHCFCCERDEDRWFAETNALSAVGAPERRKDDLRPLTPAARELLKLDWSAL
jgi:hypothetical protein